MSSSTISMFGDSFILDIFSKEKWTLLKFGNSILNRIKMWYSIIRMQDLDNLIYSLKIATSTIAQWYIDITASLYISKKNTSYAWHVFIIHNCECF